MKKPAKETTALPLPGMIEAQEARGQAELVASESIPTRWAGYAPDSDAVKGHDEMLRQLGFELGEPFADDPLFRPAKLPPGWKRMASHHPMHSDIVDDKGLARLGMFYKAAFYDRRAHLSRGRRVYTTMPPGEPFDLGHRTRIVVIALPVRSGEPDRAKVLARFDATADPEDPKRFAVWDKLDQDVRDWCDKHYPHMDDPMAYWDLDASEMSAEVINVSGVRP